VPANLPPTQAPVQLPSLPPLTMPGGMINLGPLTPQTGNNGAGVPQASVQTLLDLPSPAASASVPGLPQPTDYSAVPPGVRVNYMNRAGQAPAREGSR
jgi:hypothetical protein